MTPREETEIVGFQFDQVEDGGAGEEEHDNEEDSAECQGRRIEGEPGFKQSHRLLPLEEKVLASLSGVPDAITPRSRSERINTEGCYWTC